MDEPSGLTHVDPEGLPRMVDVTAKEVTRRVAVASGWIRMRPETLEVIETGSGPKGDILSVAQIAGIQGGKRTADLLPLCHALPGASLEVTVEPDPGLPGVRVTARATYEGKTGVEMEALTAVGVALLTVYDMVKAVDRGMVIEQVRLDRKEGGRSGSWERGSGGE